MSVAENSCLIHTLGDVLEVPPIPLDTSLPLHVISVPRFSGLPHVIVPDRLSALPDMHGTGGMQPYTDKVLAKVLADIFSSASYTADT